MKTVRTVIFTASGYSADGQLTRQVKRCVDSLWKKQGGEAGMKAWLTKRDPRYAKDVDVKFEGYEDVDPEAVRTRPSVGFAEGR